MKLKPTTFAKGVIYLIALSALSICFILLPELVREESVQKPINISFVVIFFIIAYTIAIPFFLALWQAIRLLKLIEHNKAFSPESVNALNRIKRSFITFTALIMLAITGSITIFKFITPQEDITFIFTFGFIIVFVMSIVTTFIVLLQKLLMDAVSLKSENDLII